MRHHPRTRAARAAVLTALAATLSTAAVPAAASAAKPPHAPKRTVIARIPFPANPQDSPGYNTVQQAGSAIISGALRADGSFALIAPTYFKTATSRLDTTAFDPFAKIPTVAVTPVDGTAGRIVVDGLLTGVDGYDWIVTAEPAAELPLDAYGNPQYVHRLMALDDTGKLVKAALLPPTVDATLVATTAGIRVVREVAANGTEVADAGGKTIARLPSFLTSAASTGGDGALVLQGISRVPLDGVKASTTVRLSVSPAGRVRVLHTTTRGAIYGRVTNPTGGTLYTPLDGAEDNPRIALDPAHGKPIYRTAKQLRIRRSADCIADGDGLQIVGLPSPSGKPLVRLDCLGDGGRDSTVNQSTLVGLDRHLRVSWTADVTAVNHYDDYQPVTGATGTLLGVAYSGADDGLAITSQKVPGAKALRGAILKVGKDATAPYVRIRCRHAVGMVCSGTATLRVDGTAVDTVRYALPARPGDKAAVIVRHFDPELRGDGRLAVTLAPLPKG